MNTSETAISDRSGDAPIIRLLRIERFRGIKSLLWRPSPRMNLLLGGGDAGKTTILEAIGLLLTPSGFTVLNDFDYYGRNVEPGFQIEAAIALPDACGADFAQTKWPWLWNGEEAVIPSIEESDKPGGNDSVFRIRVKGTPDLEAVHEVLQPDSSTANLSAGLRKEIGLLNLGARDDDDRDLRLVHGSALERLVGDSSLKARVALELGKMDFKSTLDELGRKSLAGLNSAFEDSGLPSNLGITVVGSKRYFSTSMVGITSSSGEVELPLTVWGAGTRRLAALKIGELNATKTPLTLIDEAERGLEPYRQRLLVSSLNRTGSQVFVTTHSPTIVAAADDGGARWHLGNNGSIGEIRSKHLIRLCREDPNALLSKLTLVGEGATEVGFLKRLFEEALGTSPNQYGIHIADGGGNDATLEIVKALNQAGIRFGAFVDNEGNHDESWNGQKEALDDLLFRWDNGCLESNIVPSIPDDEMPAFIEEPDGQGSGQRLWTIAKRAGSAETDFDTLAQMPDFRATLLDACLGSVPEGLPPTEKRAYQAHAKIWFKSERGGRELAEKTLASTRRKELTVGFLALVNSALQSVGVSPRSEI